MAAAAAKARFFRAQAFVWRAETQSLAPVTKVSRVEISLLRGVDLARDQLLGNTERFASGCPPIMSCCGARAAWANARWSRRPMPISTRGWRNPRFCGLKLIEIHREDIEILPVLMGFLREAPYPFFVFCDDLSFDGGDASYKSLKAALEGGVEGRPDNVLFYATSNRRHLLPRDMMDNERSTAINPGEAVEEKVSLSDRFGLWLGFHKCSQDDYLAMVSAYVALFQLKAPPEQIRAEALEWAITRASRSGRAAFQYIQDLAGRLGQSSTDCADMHFFNPSHVNHEQAMDAMYGNAIQRRCF